MATIKLSKDNIEDTIENNDIIVIDFWAPWCAPCKAFGPVFEEISESHDDIVFAKCNTDEQQELAGMFQITGIPTLIIFREKIGLFKQPGMLQKDDLVGLLKEIKALDMDDIRKQMAEQEKKSPEEQSE